MTALSFAWAQPVLPEALFSSTVGQNRPLQMAKAQIGAHETQQLMDRDLSLDRMR